MRMQISSWGSVQSFIGRLAFLSRSSFFAPAQFALLLKDNDPSPVTIYVERDSHAAQASAWQAPPNLEVCSIGGVSSDGNVVPRRIPAHPRIAEE